MNLLSRADSLPRAFAALLTAAARLVDPQDPAMAARESSARVDVGHAVMLQQAAQPAGCELEAREGACALESVTVEGEGAAGSRDVVAVYRTTGEGSSVRITRRFRTVYVTGGEAAQLAHVQANPTATCRWQVVTHGSCAAWSGEVALPEMTVNRRVLRAEREEARALREEAREADQARRHEDRRLRHAQPVAAAMTRFRPHWGGVFPMLRGAGGHWCGHDHGPGGHGHGAHGAAHGRFGRALPRHGHGAHHGGHGRPVRGAHRDVRGHGRSGE